MPELQAPFTLTGVYTTGGGTYTWLYGEYTGSGDWAYLYNGDGKRGLVMKNLSGTDEGMIVAYLGSDVDADNFSSNLSIYTFTPAYDPAGIISEPYGEFVNE